MDDIFIMAADSKILSMAKKDLNSCFKLTDMGNVRLVLGMNLIHRKEGLNVTKSLYINKIVGRLNLQDKKIKAVPLSKGCKL